MEGSGKRGFYEGGTGSEIRKGSMDSGNQRRKKKEQERRKYNNGIVGEIFCRIAGWGRMKGNDGKWWEKWDRGERSL